MATSRRTNVFSRIVRAVVFPTVKHGRMTVEQDRIAAAYQRQRFADENPDLYGRIVR